MHPPRRAVEAWQGSVHSYAPTVQDSGIERLTIEFSNPGPYGAHASDRGFNAIFLLAAANVWVQQVRQACLPSGIPFQLSERLLWVCA